MSHTIMKGFHISKEGNPVIIGAENNVHPRSYRDMTYTRHENPRDNVKDIVVLMLEGMIVPQDSKDMNKENRPGFALKRMNGLIEDHAPDITLERDFETEVNNLGKLYELVAANYGVPMLYKEPVNTDKCITLIRQLNEAARKEYEYIIRDMQENKIISIRAAYRMKIEGFDVLITKDNEECVICKTANYNNRGKLDNSDDSAVNLGKDAERLFYKISASESVEDLIELLKGTVSEEILDRLTKLLTNQE